jgi:predicted acylesterase/phospholipase RssA
MSPPNRPIFAIFEGGGAKGISHIGALRAIEENGLTVIGVGGTSAGALVATLAAIGLEADDIMSATDKGANLLARAGLTPPELLGLKDWQELERLRRHGKLTVKVFFLAGVVGAFLFGPRTTSGLVRILRNRGHLRTDEIRDFINETVRKRLVFIREEAGLAVEVPERVRFRDLNDELLPTVVPLKIVVTDVDGGDLVIFDRHATPDVEVGEAVAASIAIPLVFYPAKIPSFRADGEFADGGLVANLPTWIFSEEKLAYEREHYSAPPVPIIGFTLRESAKAAPKRDIASHLVALAQTALESSQGVSQKFLEDLVVVRLKAPLTLLEFDAPWTKLRDCYEAGRTSADEQLRLALQAKPDRVKAELERTHQDVLDHMNKGRATAGLPGVRHLRANLAQPFGDLSLRITHGFNMADDADDRLLLDHRGRGAAQAFRERDMVVIKIGGVDDDPDHEFMTKYERALVRGSVKSLMAAPIFEDPDAWSLPPTQRPPPAGVLSLDSDEDLDFDLKDNDLYGLLAKQSAVFFAALTMKAVENG